MQHQNLFKQLFGKSAWDSDNAIMLQDIVKEFPYFSLAHFYLLKETGIGHGDYKSISAKLALHFNNAYLLHLQMHQTETIITQNPENKAEVEKIIHVAEPVLEKLLIRQVALSNQAPANEDMLFEPLFATDYFASQGIKLSEDVQSSDKLGKQLKSFTEWLKTIKKTHNYTPPEPKQMDQNVAKLAEKSNIETEVITEAMAEVYLQQGKISKANEVYEKLSLQNPAKSTYFACKIENLNAK
jgi:hypothetical protein